MTQPLLLSHLTLLNHGKKDHPEHSGRLEAIFKTIEKSPWSKFLDLSIERRATVEELSYVHDPTYIAKLLSLEGEEVDLDQETVVTAGSIHAALVAAGLGIELVERLLRGEIAQGFALVRPPGHHARPHQAMGFCLFNNIAIAAKRALSLGVKRILLLDWDVHHGNGTQETFYQEERVFFIDLHQENLFPLASGVREERGKGRGMGYTLNIPIPPHSHDDDYLYLFETVVEPLARRYLPELILVSAGFDAHESDPLGMMRLTERGYGQLTAKVVALADQLCGGRVIFFLEGGYNPYYLARNLLSCVKACVEKSESGGKVAVEAVSSQIVTLAEEILRDEETTGPPITR